MTPRRKLSAVLLESERITAEDVERALAHQRTHGGYFGQALVDLGLVRREEIEWALADQLDLPFIFPDPESADPQATRLVSPAWALAHVAVPYVRTADALTVVVADPLHYETIEALRTRTGLEVEMALATPARIRALIRAVYGAGDAEAAPAGEPAAVSLGDFVTEALARGADRLGVSVRGTRAQGWYAAGEARERRRLEDGWQAALEALLDPWPPPAEDQGADGSGPGPAFQATLRGPAGPVPVEARALANVSGSELLLRPRRAAGRPPSSGAALPAGLRADLRLLAAAGSARVAVAGPTPAVDGVLPSLPALVLGDDVRAAHVAVRADLPGVYAVPAGDGPEVVALVEACAFDALTTDLPLDDRRLPAILAAAPLSFVRVPPGSEPRALEAAGLGWVLTLGGGTPEPAKDGERDPGPGHAAGWDLRAVAG